MSRIILRDGRVAELRKARNTQSDRAKIRELFQSVSAESLYFRFFHVVKEIGEEVIQHMIGDGGKSGLTLLCLAGERAIAIGSYVRVEDDVAEVAFLVDDHLQGRGLGSLLLEHLAEFAWKYGIQRFEANILSENYRMLQVFRASGFELTSERDAGMVHLIWSLGQTERSLARRDMREQMATAVSLHPFFQPQTVGVIGASRDSQALGHLLFRHLLDSEFQGTVYPINPTAHAVAAVRAYSNVAAVPEKLDLAVIAVPAQQVLSVIDDCITANVKSVLIASSGFSETDAHGVELEREIVRRLRASGCRLIGPNSLGILNMNPEVQLNASFAPFFPEFGMVAIASHSGALGIAILEYAHRIHIGISSFVSLGNRADVSVNDLLQYWETDPDTKMIWLYLESFGNPRKFSRIARRISKRKPIIAVKSARTPTSLSVSKGHTIAIAADDEAVHALFSQAGIVRVDTLQELFDVSALISTPVMALGSRVAIVTNTAGGAVISVDTLLREGLQFASPVINLGFEALAESYRTVLPHVLRDPTVDAVMVIFTPVGISDEEAVREAIVAAICEVAADDSSEDVVGLGRKHHSSKPVVANFLTTGDYLLRYIQVTDERRIPIYPFPEQAVRALAKLMEYHRYRVRDYGHIPDLEGFHGNAARDIVRTSLKNGIKQSWLEPASVRAILFAAGFPVLDDHSKGNQPLLEISLTVAPDPLFGPLLQIRVLASSLQRHKEFYGKLSEIRLMPLTDVDVDEMLDHVLGEHKGIRNVTGFHQLKNMILRISQLVEEIPELLRIEFSKLTVFDEMVFWSKCRMEAQWFDA